MTNRDDVAMLQRMFLNQLAIDISAIGAVQIFEKRIIKYVDNQGVVTTDGGVVNTHIIVREASDRITLLAHVVFGQDLIVQAQD